MPNCVTCGKELNPERAEKYDYCTDPQCQERNAKGLWMVAVGVNKAADQYMVLDDRTKKEMARGRFKKQPEVAGSVHMPSRSRRSRTPKAAPAPGSRSAATASRRRWSEAQENLALIYLSMGMKPDEIAKKLGASEQLVTEILLTATARGRR
jgi:hypothetical protein